jgi:hypothetical protein
MNILPNVTAVHVLLPGQSPNRAKINFDNADLHIVNTETSLQGGVWLAIANIWLAARTKYVCYLPPFYGSLPGRFNAQIDFMEHHDLAGCYTDIKLIDPDNNEISLCTFTAFDADMIGTPAIPNESLLINRKKFLDTGGFDTMIAGCYDPVRYITTMTACAGRIMHLNKHLVSLSVDSNGSTLGLQRDLSYRDEDFHDIHKRFRMDKWITRARTHYKSMRW